MVDRQELRDKASSAGESIAGTFKAGAKKAKDAGKQAAKTTKQGAQNIKDDITGAGDEGEVDLIYSQESETYTVLGPDNENLGQFDDEMKAKAAARNAKRELDDQSAKSGFKDKATDAARRVGDSLSGAADSLEPAEGDSGGDSDGGGLLGGGGGGLMGGGDMDSGGGPTLPGAMGGMDSDDGDSSPTLPGGFGGMDDGDGPGMPMGGGDDAAPSLPGGMGGDGAEPGVPFLAGDDDGTGPMVPDFAGTNNDEMVQLPGIMDGDPTNNEDSDGQDAEVSFPWMF